MAKIAIEGMEFFSYHGHFKEETVIGTKFLVDLFFETNTYQAELSDLLEDTINYQTVYLLVKEQMQKPSNLIESVARRIIEALMLNFPEIEYAELKLQKLNPPLGGQIRSVSITLNSNDSKFNE